MMYKIMIVEDDENLRENMRCFLEEKGYNVYLAKDFRNIESLYRLEKPALMLLDINLPYDDGLYICSSIRRESTVPIIFVSARKRDVEQVMGIEVGGDDYITKPFSLEVLAAKIKGILRRCYGTNSEEKEDLYGIELDESSFKLKYEGKSVELSKNEFKLIRKFLDNEDTVISREELLAELWDDSTFIDDNTLTVNVTRVKNILASLGIKNVIKTKRGYGYIFDLTELKRGIS